MISVPRSFCSGLWLPRGNRKPVRLLPHTHISPVLLLEEAPARRLCTYKPPMARGWSGCRFSGAFGISRCCLLTARGLPPWCWLLVPGSLDSGPRSEKLLLPQFLLSEHYPKNRGMASLLQVPAARPLWVSEQGQRSSSTLSRASARGAGPNRAGRRCRAFLSILAPGDPILSIYFTAGTRKEKKLMFNGHLQWIWHIILWPHLSFTTTRWGTVAQRD